MKKKLLLAAVLLGALSLGSCVDNNESESVTAVRNAKAEQLKALANLANSQAEAATITANAEAALKQAQAAYQEALAAYQQALTDKAKAEAQEAMARAQAEVQRIAAQLELDLLNLKTQTLQAQAAYEKALLNQATQNLGELTNLYNTYKGYADQLLVAQQNLAAAKILLTKYQAQIIDNAEMRQEQISQLSDQIAQLESDIEAANAAIEMYKKYNTNTAEAQEALKKAETAKEEASQVLRSSIATRNQASTNNSKAWQTIYNSAYMTAFRDFRRQNPSFNDINIAYIYDWETGENGRPLPNAGTFGASYYSEETNEQVYIPLFYTWSKSEEQTIEYSFGEGLPVQTFTYWEYTDYNNPIEGGLDAYTKALNASLAANQTKNVTMCTADFNKAKTAYDDAKKAYEAAAAADKEAKKAEMDAKKELMNEAERALVQAENAETVAKEQLAQILAMVGTLQAQAKNHVANVEAYNEANRANSEAYVAYLLADNDYTVKASEVTALQNIINGNDVTAQITAQENIIKNNTAAIKALKEQIFDLENTTSDDDLIATQEALIANLETEVSILQKQVDAAKAALEAAINAGSED